MSEEKAAISEKEQQIQEMEQFIANLETLIKHKQMVENLLHNKDFCEVILDGYCKTEVIRYMKLVVNDELSVQARDNALEMAEDAIKLRVFLDTVTRFGALAERDIADARKALAEMESEKED